jgi:adenylosuccinate synthase
MLDLDHGSYPFVTSSSPTAGGACIGAGIGPTIIDRVIGISKAFMTRVGEGPFPTEQDGEEGEMLRQTGKPWAEVGVTTGRPKTLRLVRHCHWSLRSARVNGLDCLAITKLDVMDEFDEIKICVAYKDKKDGSIHKELPSIGSQFKRMEPVYKSFPWLEKTHIQNHELRRIAC